MNMKKRTKIYLRKKWVRLLLLGIALFSIPLVAQDAMNQVTGIVTDSNGEVLAGVTIVEKGTGNGTITNAEGRFSISVHPKATLSFSFISYKSQDIAVNNRQVINVVLQEDVQALEHVV